MLVEYLAKAGHDVTVVTQSKSISGVQVEDFPKFRLYRNPSAMLLLILSIKADLVFQNNVELRTLIPALLLGKPFVISLHTWLRDCSGVKRIRDRIKQLVLFYARKVISVSYAISYDIAAPSVVIPNPYRESIFKLRDSILRKEAISFVGRLVSDKGVDLLLEAFALLVYDELFVREFNRGVANLTLSIYGDGPEKERLEKLAIDLGIANKVFFRGSCEPHQLAHGLNRHLLLVVPSRWPEPFGLVALEGAACGCVVLGSNAGGLPEAVGPTGLLYRHNDLEDLRCKLHRLLIDAQLRESFQSQAQHHLANHHQDPVLKRYLALVEGVLSTRSG